jgi:hypothetical protein
MAIRMRGHDINECIINRSAGGEAVPQQTPTSKSQNPMNSNSNSNSNEGQRRVGKQERIRGGLRDHLSWGWSLSSLEVAHSTRHCAPRSGPTLRRGSGLTLSERVKRASRWVGVWELGFRRRCAWRAVRRAGPVALFLHFRVDTLPQLFANPPDRRQTTGPKGHDAPSTRNPAACPTDGKLDLRILC